MACNSGYEAPVFTFVWQLHRLLFTETAIIAKSSILLDVKPWDDETDLGQMEKMVRTIELDGLLWGTSKLVPVGYGIKKLVIMCVVEDDKVSLSTTLASSHYSEMRWFDGIAWNDTMSIWISWS